MPSSAPQKSDSFMPSPWRKLLRAAWKGAIEAGKAAPSEIYGAQVVAAFYLGFLEDLREQAASLQEKDRTALLRDLPNARIDDIANELQSLQNEFGSLQNKEKTFAKQLAFLANNQERQRSDLAEVALAFFRIISDHENRLLSIEEIAPSFDQIKDLPLDIRAALRKELQEHAKEEEKRRFYEFECNYLRDIQREYEYLQLLGIPNQKRDLESPADEDYRIDIAFINLALSRSDGSRESLHNSSSDTILASNSQLVIRGLAGAGKTTLLQWEAVQCALASNLPPSCDLASTCNESITPESLLLKRMASPQSLDPAFSAEQRRRRAASSPWSNHIPFFLRFRNWVGANEEMPRFEDWVSLSIPNSPLCGEVPAGWIRFLLENGRAILFFDGLDEFPASLRPAFWAALRRLLRDYPNLCFRVTSRPLPKEEESTAQWRIPEGVPILNILPLAPSQIDELIRKWYEAAIKANPNPDRARRRWGGYPRQLQEVLRQPLYRRVMELAENPFLCAAIALIFRDNNQILPNGRRDLYEQLCIALLKRREEQKQSQAKQKQPPADPLFDQLELNELMPVHAHLAWKLMRNPDSQVVGGSQESKEYRLEAERTVFLHWIGSSLAWIINEEVRARAREHPEELLNHLLLRRGLLREPAAGRIDFPHRALQEYLAATAVFQERELVFLLNQLDDDRWRDTIILAAGGYYAGMNDANLLIQHLIERGDKGSRRGYALAVACLGTAKIVSEEIRKCALENLAAILPPANSEEARALSAAGDAVVPFLKYDSIEMLPIMAARKKTEKVGEQSSVEDRKEMKATILAACAETLALIGSDAAREQLKKGYGLDPREEIVREVLRCPGIHALEILAVVKDVAQTRALTIPNFARPYLKDLRPLRNFPNLESLELHNCSELANIDDLASQTALRTLRLSNCPRIEDLTPLSKLTQLQTLELDRCTGIADLSPLENLTGLQSLNLHCCEKVTCLAPLQGLYNLQKLDLANCGEIRDFSPLGTLPNLRSLDLQGLPKAEYPAIIIKSCSCACPGKDFLETTAGLNLQMVWIPSGTFQMGSNELNWAKPIHKVSIDAFWIAKYQTTQAQYEAIMGENPSAFKGPNNPVECVSWNEAVEFCRRLSEKNKLRFALPTEAQWEYACRSRSAARYCFGDSERELDDYGWYDKNSEGRTHPAGGKKPNNWGLYDMHGNVWEWCVDTWHSNYNEALIDRNAIESSKSPCHVFRGGGWGNLPELCRSASRGWYGPGVRDIILGFRVVA